ncbi:hypothetical protein B0O99DRAFT_519570, partial [Bisporella sp. PMI_857]
VVQDIIAVFGGKTPTGALTVGDGAAEAYLDILPRCPRRKVINKARYPNPSPLPTRYIKPQVARRGIRRKFIWAGNATRSEVGPRIRGDLLPEAPKGGRLVPAPKAEAVGTGLDNVEKGLDLLMKGVSAEKLVVML